MVLIIANTFQETKSLFFSFCRPISKFKNKKSRLLIRNHQIIPLNHHHHQISKKDHIER
jgi:hypothetical protein